METNLGPVIDIGAIRNINLDTRNMNILHINAQSIVPTSNSTKFDEIRTILVGQDFDVVGVSESWLKDFVVDNAVSIEGYRLYRVDRPIGRGGGVCVYVKSELKSKVVHEVRNYCESEGIFLEVEMEDNIRLLVGVIYCPYGNIWSCEEALADVTSRYEHNILMGDFNINLFERVSSQRCSLIDYFLVSHDNLVCDKGQFLFPALNSHHAAIFISYNMRKMENAHELEIRDFSSFNIDNCLRELYSSDFTQIYTTNDTNIQVNIFTRILRDNFDRHVPKRIVRRRRFRDWFGGPYIVEAREMRDFAYRAFVEDGSQSNWKGIWSELKRLGICEGLSHTTDVDTEACNKYFSLPRLNDPPNVLFESNVVNDFNGFSFRNVSEEELWCAVSRVKSNSVGDDGIPIKFVRMIFPSIARHLLHICNTVLTSSSYPRAWKVAKVIPVPKVKNPCHFSEFRPISIVPALSKVVEILMDDQIGTYLMENSVISDNQSGFRKGYSTTTLLVDLVDEVRRRVDLKEFVLVVSLDFSRAFDSISHEVLLNKMFHKYGLSLSACRLLKTFLVERSQFVFCNGFSSSTRSLYRGIPQGSIIGPKLFSLYINDIFEVLSFMKCHLYADDLQLIISGGVGSEIYTENIVNLELMRLDQWCQSNYIAINPCKSSFDIVVLSDIFAEYADCKNKLINFNPIQKFRDDVYGGVAIGLKKHIKFSIVTYASDLDIVIVKTKNLPKNLTIASVYFPPSLALVAEVGKLCLFLDRHKNPVLVSDFNTRNTIWGDLTRNRRGRELNDIINNTYFKCWNMVNVRSEEIWNLMVRFWIYPSFELA
ncbi:uncharacterized protein LOC142224618 [Haematobia irritans]|uniref:uncharacterized protein LOC142224618 n=1 Tax=Haematobia irritans TaxID=7368 RepID=UPI003F50CAA6